MNTPKPAGELDFRTRWQQDLSNPGIDLTSSEYAVAMALSTCVNFWTKKAFPGITKLASITRLSEPTVKRALKGLRSKGIVKCLSVGGNAAKLNSVYMLGELSHSDHGDLSESHSDHGDLSGAPLRSNEPGKAAHSDHRDTLIKLNKTLITNAGPSGPAEVEKEDLFKNLLDSLVQVNASLPGNKYMQADIDHLGAVVAYPYGFWGSAGTRDEATRDSLAVVAQKFGVAITAVSGSEATVYEAAA